MIDRFIELLIAATANIPELYFNLPVAGQEDTIYRERVYCYELYHQLRKLLEKEEQLAGYTLSGEIDKRAHPIIEELCAPDFVFHNPGDMDNLVIIEVKHIHAEADEVEKDLGKLARFVNNVGYQRGVQLVYGEHERGLARFEPRFRKAGTDRLQLYWHRKPGEPATRIYPPTERR